MQMEIDTIFKNPENSKTTKPHALMLLNLTDKIDLQRGEKSVVLSNGRKFKTSAATWHYELESPDGRYSVSDIKDYFEHI